MKTKAKHTLGPWEIHGTEVDSLFYVHGANRIADIAKPSGFYRSPKETEANARLICAAPDLLAALERILNAHDSGNNGAYMGEAVLCRMFADQAREAIAKAKGTP